MKMVLGVNVLDSVGAAPYLSHVVLAGYSYKNIPNLQISFYAPERMSIDRMRNMAADIALRSECDYLCFIDDDVIVEPNTIQSLLDALEKSGADVAMAETYVRGIPYNAMFFKDRNGKLEHYNDFEAEVDSNGLVECDAVGFSAVLIKCDLLKKLSKPYFVTGPSFTEDVYFCVKAKEELGKDKVKYVVDTRVPTGHTLTGHYIHKSNVKNWREFDSGMLPMDEIERADRPQDYVDKIEKIFEEK